MLQLKNWELKIIICIVLVKLNDKINLGFSGWSSRLHSLRALLYSTPGASPCVLADWYPFCMHLHISAAYKIEPVSDENWNFQNMRLVSSVNQLLPQEAGPTYIKMKRNKNVLPLLILFNWFSKQCWQLLFASTPEQYFTSISYVMISFKGTQWTKLSSLEV